jgi:two-component system, OmpR family, sensor histidine kinase ArlS
MTRFTVWYMMTLFLIMIILGSIILISTSYFLINTTKQDTYLLQDQLIKASREHQIDWHEAINNLLYPNYGNYYIKITNSKGEILAQSHGWDQITTTTNYSKIDSDWIKNVLLNQEKEIYYTSTVSWTQSNGKMGEIIVIAQLNHIRDFLSFLKMVLLVSTLLGCLLGSITIYFVTKRNIKPLKNITNTVSKIQDFSDFKKRVPIPKGPHELTKLANTFNDLFIKIEDQFIKERAFVSNASHELRTPITAFKGHINLLKRWGKSDPEILNQSINALEIEGDRMQRLISQLLNLARTDSPYIERSILNLGQIIKDVEGELYLSHNHQLEIINHIDLSVRIHGNLDQIRQVVIILIENAIKYTNKGGKIEISAFKKENWGGFEVKDSGIGIHEEEIPLIFRRFYRIDKARSRKTGGSGLGLAIAKDIVENHGGYIDVQSKLGLGSKFIVKFPLAY